MTRKPSPSRRSSLVHLLAPSLYLALALLLWWPLPAHLTTHVPGSETWAFDEYTFVWNLWWFRHALMNGLDPLHSDFIFYPLGVDLVLYTYNVLNAAVALPLLPWLGPVLSSNLLLLGMTVLSGWGTWLLVRWLLWRTLAVRGTGAQVAAWGAGSLYAFGAYRAVYAALGHYDMVSTGFIPLFTLFFLKTLGGGAHPRRAALLAGAFLAGALLNEMIFGVFLAMLAGILLLAMGRRAAPGWPGRLALLAGTAALLWAPVGVPVVRTLLSTDYVLSGWGDALKLSADLFSFVAPTALHPWWGPPWEAELRAVRINAVAPGASRFSDVNTVFVGISTLLLCALAAWRFRRVVAGWALGLATFAVLALGPLLQVGGRYQWSFDGVLPDGQLTAVPLPFLLLHYLPIVQGNRAANRFSVVLLLCAAVLVGYALWWVAEGEGKRQRAKGKGQKVDGREGQASGGQAAVGLEKSKIPERAPALGESKIRLLPVFGLIALLLLEQLALPLPLTDARIPPGYAQVAQDPNDVAVLTLPLGWRNSFGVVGAENTRNQWYQAGHRKRLVQGNTSRAPAEKFDFWRRLPVLRSLIEIQNDRDVPEAQQADDAARALETMTMLGVRYVAVHPAVPGRPPYEDNRERALAFLRDVLPLEPLYEGDDLLLFRVADPDGPALRELDFGAAASEMYQVAGWHSGEAEGDVTFTWATAESTFLLPHGAGGVQPLEVVLHLRPFQLPQSVQPLVNGQRVGAAIPLEPGWNEVRLTVPPTLLDGPTARVTLRFSRTDRPMDRLPDSTLVGSTGAALRVPVTLKSGGPEVSDPAWRDLAWITVAGEDASAHRAGTNVTVIDPTTGVVEAVRGFDTTANEFERDRLHAFIAAIPAGRVVAVALQGAATSFLNLDTVAAFQSLGAATGPTDHAVSYALLGVKGAAPGTALEAQARAQAVDLAHTPDDRSLSSAVDRVRWTWQAGRADP